MGSIPDGLEHPGIYFIFWNLLLKLKIWVCMSSLTVHIIVWIDFTYAMSVVFYFTFYYELSKNWCGCCGWWWQARCAWWHMVHIQTISTLFGIYILYIIAHCHQWQQAQHVWWHTVPIWRFYLYKLLHNFAHCCWQWQAWCMMQSLFGHNVMFYLYKLLHNVALCHWWQQAQCMCGDMQSISRLFAISIKLLDCWSTHRGE